MKSNESSSYLFLNLRPIHVKSVACFVKFFKISGIYPFLDRITAWERWSLLSKLYSLMADLFDFDLAE